LKLRADFSYWKEFLRESFPMGAVAMITFLYYRLDTILLSVMRPSADVGIYNAAYKIIDNVSFFPGMFMGLIMPIMAKNFFSDQEKFRRVSNKTFKVFIILVVPLVVGTVFLADDIIRIIGGAGFGESANVLRILVFALAFIFFGNFFNSIMVAGNFQKKLMYILGLAAIVNIALNLIFIPRFSYTAASVSSVITEFLVATLTCYAVARKTGYLPKIEKLGGILFSGLMMAAILFFFRGANFFALFFGSSAVYFFFLWAFKSIGTNEIKSLIRKNERENPA
jgi:O-antigen/teichoic acid export membrane protein